MPEKEITFWKILFNSVILSFPLIFVMRFLFSKASSGMIKDMRGDDGRWQFNEISQAASIVMSVVSWLVIISMIFLTGALDQAYPLEAWLTMIFMTAGSQGVEAMVIYVKGKYGTK